MITTMSKRSTKFYRKNEEDVMQRLGFKPTKNSGAGWIEKEDGQSDKYICQLKSTDNQSISIKQNDLHILEYNASVSHKIPVFAFQFLNTDEVWVAIKGDEFERFKAFMEHEEKEEIETIDIDISEEKDYNIYKGSRNVGKSYLARKNYLKQIEEEKQQKEKEYKERRRQNNWKRNSNKKV